LGDFFVMGVGLGVTVLSAALAVALYFAAENVKKT
jgi:hypothetical protein